MAFYKDFNKQSGEEKRKSAQMKGGFEDEGSRYGGAKGTSRTKRGEGGYGKGQQGGYRFASGGQQRYDERGSRTGSPRPYSEQRQGRPSDAPRSYGEQRPPRQGDGQRPYGSQRPGRPEGPRPYSEQRQGRPEGPRPYGDRSYNDRSNVRPYNDRRSDRSSFAPATSRPHPSRSVDNRNDRNVRNDRGDRKPQGYTAEGYRYDAPVAYDAPTVSDTPDVVPNENLLSGRNPIREALKSGRDIEKLLISRGELSGSAREIVQMAKEKHIPVQEVDRVRLDAITPNHQGMLAFASAYQYSTVGDMLTLAEAKGEAPLLVLLDGITDPHNLGAIIRSAECAGAHGVIVQERRAVGLTPAAVKASAGAVEYLPVARVTNLTSTIEELQKKNIWVFAADMGGEDFSKTDFSGPLALVIGAEGEGVSRRVLETCDKKVSLPIRGKLDSLNASVAAGILLYAALRTR